MTPVLADGDNTGQVRTITDMDNWTVTIPSTVSSVVITCCGGTAHELATLGVSDRSSPSWSSAAQNACNLKTLQ